MDQNELYSEYLAQQKFEHELINRRITWLLTSQTILFAAYGLGASVDSSVPQNFLCVVAASGLISSLLLFVGIVANVLAKRRSWKDYLDVVDDCEASLIPDKLEKLRREWGVSSRITCVALFPDILLPLLFFTAWALVI